MTLFDAYLMVYELMVKLDPKLFRNAVRSIKKHRSFKLDIPYIKRIKKIYPDMIPDVFERLWCHQPDGKERLLKRKIFNDARNNWRNRLIDKGLIKEAKIELPRAEMLTGSLGGSP